VVLTRNLTGADTRILSGADGDFDADHGFAFDGVGPGLMRAGADTSLAGADTEFEWC
jgi:hypothetical protein